MDDKDILLLQMLSENSGRSLAELRDAIQCRSQTTVWNRLNALAEQGLVSPPPKKNQPRSVEITETGKQRLNQALHPKEMVPLWPNSLAMNTRRS